MIKTIIYFSGAFLFLFVLLGCKKKFNSLPPNELYFRITKNGKILPDSVLNKISLFYFDEKGIKIENPPANYDDKTFLFPGSNRSPGLEGKGVLSSGYIANISFAQSVNNFFLKYPDGDVDTIYVEVGDIGDKGASDRCYCYHPFSVVRFNGKAAPEVTDISTDDGKPIFAFEK